MARILHTADWHVGQHTHGRTDPEFGVSTRTLELKRSLGWLVDSARELAPDLVAITGDLAHTKMVNGSELALLATTLGDLADIAPVAGVLGNHDLEAHLERVSTAGAIASAVASAGDVGRIHFVAAAQLLYMEPGLPPLLLLPYPNKATIETYGMSLGEAGNMMEEYISTQAELHPGLVVCGHFTLAAAKYNAEAQPLISTGLDFMVSPQVFDNPNIEAALFGHIHHPQNVGKRGKSSFCGSLMALSFGEGNCKHGFQMYDTETHEFTYFENPYSPEFVTFQLDEGFTDEQILQGLEPGSYVRFKSNEPVSQSRKALLPELISKAGSAYCGLTEKKVRVLRTGTEKVGGAETPEMAVIAYCEVNDIPEPNYFVGLMHEADAANER